MERLLAHLPPGTTPDAEGKAPWPHPTISLAAPDPLTGATSDYRVDFAPTPGFVPVSGSLSFTQRVEGDVLFAALTMEALLAIVEHRLNGFQRGPAACAENEEAAYHVSMALEALHGRSVRLSSPNGAEAPQTGAQPRETAILETTDPALGTDIDQDAAPWTADDPRAR